ncbi:MAG: hypothetical protein AAB288_00565, partial [Acidobacteriota bacterium]
VTVSADGKLVEDEAKIGKIDVQNGQRIVMIVHERHIRVIDPTWFFTDLPFPAMPPAVRAIWNDYYVRTQRHGRTGYALDFSKDIVPSRLETLMQYMGTIGNHPNLHIELVSADLLRSPEDLTGTVRLTKFAPNGKAIELPSKVVAFSESNIHDATRIKRWTITFDPQYKEDPRQLVDLNVAFKTKYLYYLQGQKVEYTPFEVRDGAGRTAMWQIDHAEDNAEILNRLTGQNIQQIQKKGGKAVMTYRVTRGYDQIYGRYGIAGYSAAAIGGKAQGAREQAPLIGSELVSVSKIDHIDQGGNIHSRISQILPGKNLDVLGVQKSDGTVDLNGVLGMMRAEQAQRNQKINPTLVWSTHSAVQDSGGRTFAALSNYSQVDERGFATGKPHWVSFNPFVFTAARWDMDFEENIYFATRIFPESYTYEYDMNKGVSPLNYFDPQWLRSTPEWLKNIDLFSNQVALLRDINAWENTNWAARGTLREFIYMGDDLIILSDVKDHRFGRTFDKIRGARIEGVNAFLIGEYAKVHAANNT